MEVIKVLESLRLKEKIEEAYLRLKRYYYHDTNALLYIRVQIAEFEENQNLDEKFKEIKEKIMEECIGDYIDKVKALPVLKKLIKEPNKEKDIIINNYNSKNHKTERNYIIEAPIELHIISMLWVMEIGKGLDETFYVNSYGQRLNLKRKNENLEFSNKYSTFLPYFSQYQKWRDQGIKELRHILKDDKEDAILFTLDIEKFFYNISNIKVEKICVTENKLHNFLNSTIDEVNLKFKEELLIEENLNSNKKIYLKESGTVQGSPLPVGLASSMILANHFLKDIDKRILEDLSPNYYGRYVDDIILVFKKSSKVLEEKELSSKLDYFKLCLDKSVFNDKSRAGTLNEIKIENKIEGTKILLNVQLEKLKIYHFRPDDGSALLDNFENDLKLNASTFNILPEEEELMESFNKNAFSIQYNGGVNKLSSIKGLNDNKFKLSSYLSKAINFYKDSDFYSKEEFKNEVIQFFKGSYLIDYNLLWEKLFTYFLVIGEFEQNLKFYKLIIEEINKILDKELRKEKRKFLNYSFAICLALNIKAIEEHKKIIEANELDNEMEEIKKISLKIINSNMFRHRNVVFSLANFSKKEKEINFLKEDAFDDELCELKLKYSPRRIHLDEFTLYFFKNQSTSDAMYISSAKEKFNEVSDFKLEIEIEQKISNNIDFFDISNKKTNDKKLDLKSINIGLANLKIEDEYFEKNLDGTPNLSLDRKMKIFKILNEARNSSVNILIFSEMSIPFQWINLITEFSRRNNMAIIFGLDHIVKNNYCCNYLATILPYSISKHYRTSFMKLRLKNHYAPQEKEYIIGRNFNLPEDVAEPIYDLFNWEGLYFTNFNCFELANIKDRSKFIGKIDFLIASVFNKDTKYFNEVLSSSSRDLHCYVAQVNNSKYGDTLLLRPSRKDLKEVASISGGENTGLLVGKIDVNSLRNFQKTKHNLQKDNKSFKPTPPGFTTQMVWNRIKNEIK